MVDEERSNRMGHRVIRSQRLIQLAKANEGLQLYEPVSSGNHLNLLCSCCFASLTVAEQGTDSFMQRSIHRKEWCISQAC